MFIMFLNKISYDLFEKAFIFAFPPKSYDNILVVYILRAKLTSIYLFKVNMKTSEKRAK